MQILNAPTESNVLTELSYLSANVAASSSSITIENGDGFSVDDYIVIEAIAFEQAELRKISAITDETITFSEALSFAHKDGVLVQKIVYNQRKFYSSTTKTGTFSLISGATKDIEVDRPEGTFFEDDAGTSSTWYKATYYNETTATETSLDDAIAAQASQSNHYTSIYAVRKQAGLETAYGITEETVSDYRQEAENEFEGRITTIYSTPLSSKPKIGRQIVNLLAAGNLLIKEYGMEADIEVSKSGARMLARANDLIDKILDGTLKLIDDDGNIISSQNIFTATSSNTYDGTKRNKGSLVTLEDENFHAANPDTGYGSTH